MSQAEHSPLRSRSFKTTRTVVALVFREMATTYGRSAAGYIWAVAEPVAGIILLTAIFSLAFESPPLGTSFPLFYASGYLPFTMYLDISNKVANSIRFSKPLLFYPGVTYFDAILARFILNGLTQVMVTLIVVPAIILLFRVKVIIDIPALALGLLMAAVLALGVGTLNCFLITAVPSWERIWAILNRPLFIISAIFFVFESVPNPYRDWLWFNPLVHVIGQVRKGVFPTYDADYVSYIYLFGVSGAALFFGLLLLGRFHRDLINS